MHCEYNVTYKDFIESMKGYRKVSMGAAYAYYLDNWAVPVIGLAMLLVFLTLLLRGNGEAVDTWAFLPILGIAAMIGPPIFYRVKLRQAYRQRASVVKDERVAFDFDENSVRFTIAHKAEVSYAWESFTDYKETDQVATLFVKKAIFHTIPKRAMDDTTLGALRALVRQHVRKA